MASVKVKFRPSTTDGGQGTLFYRVIHNRTARQQKDGLPPLRRRVGQPSIRGGTSIRWEPETLPRGNQELHGGGYPKVSQGHRHVGTQRASLFCG